MWERMRAEKLGYPDLGNEEMAHLFAFLYTARYADEPGDQNKGQAVFQKKGCVRCHSVNGGNGIGPDLAAAKGINTPIRWTEAMWNHVPEMKEAAQRIGITWPHFENREMNDLLAYIRVNSNALLAKEFNALTQTGYDFERQQDIQNSVRHCQELFAAGHLREARDALEAALTRLDWALQTRTQMTPFGQRIQRTHADRV
jgi:cytochrome c2